jgi:hypothetical protein
MQIVSVVWLSAEVVVFFYGFSDVPGAFQILRENDEVTRAETYRIFVVRYCYLALDYKTGLLFGVLPVESALLTFPDWPGQSGNVSKALSVYCQSKVLCSLFSLPYFYRKPLSSIIYSQRNRG